MWAPGFKGENINVLYRTSWKINTVQHQSLGSFKECLKRIIMRPFMMGTWLHCKSLESLLGCCSYYLRLGEESNFNRSLWGPCGNYIADNISMILVWVSGDTNFFSEVKCIMSIQIILLFEINQNKLRVNKYWNNRSIQIDKPYGNLGRKCYPQLCCGPLLPSSPPVCLGW